ncbi:MAG: hypothetical protein WA419_06405 [Silvibacterium sp.]
MKKQRPFLLAICLLLGAVSGCAPKQTPTNEAIVIPQSDQAPYIDASSVYIDHGSTLTFKTEPGAPSDATLEVGFSNSQGPVPVCSEPNPLTGSSPLACHVIAESGEYDITITESAGGHTFPPKHVKAYIRPCNNCK